MTMDPNHDAPKDTKESVLAAIRGQKIAMRSKLSFTFETFLAVFAAIVMLVVTVALVNFILFSLRVNGHESLLSFGGRGILTFLFVFPWPLLVLDILLAFFLEHLLRRFRFGYRSPVLYLLLGIVAIAICMGLLLDRGTPFNDALLNRADHGELPAPFGELYEHIRAPAPHAQGVFRGIVTSVGTSTFVMYYDDQDDASSSEHTVIPPPGFDVSLLSPGDHVYVAGDEGDEVVHAFGIKALR